MVDGQLGLLSIRFGLMTPLKGGVGIGSTRESGNSRVPGAPGEPWNCYASAGSHARKAPRAASETLVIHCCTHIAASKTDYAAASPKR